jgi:riboflavin biosynthesis pyrimidine reductase
VSVVRQALMAGLVDQLDVHVAPVLLGRGVRLFEPTDLLQNGQGIELTPTRVLSQDDVTHLRYEVGGAQLLTDDDF